MKLIDLTGQVIGRLTVLERADNRVCSSGQQHVYWRCQCSCGKTTNVNAAALRLKTTRSCGCLKREVSTHVMSMIGKYRKANYSKGIICGKCSWCGNDIVAKPSRKSKMRFCSLDCYWKASAAPRTTTCLVCGKIIQVRPSVPRKFCSKECFHQHANDGDGIFRGILHSICCRGLGRKRGRAQEIGVSLQDLKDLWQKQKGVCPYTGWKLVLKTKGKTVKNQASVDRIDNSKGYVKGNLQFVAIIANYAKNQFSEKELIEFCQAVSGNVQSLLRDRNGFIFDVPS